MGSQLNRISQVREASKRWSHKVRHSDLLPAPQHDTLPWCKPKEECKLSQVKTCEAMSQVVYLRHSVSARKANHNESQKAMQALSSKVLAESIAFFNHLLTQI